MLETAGAALAVDRFLASADLEESGLNDLVQSMFGADRDLPAARTWIPMRWPCTASCVRLPSWPDRA